MFTHYFIFNSGIVSKILSQIVWEIVLPNIPIETGVVHSDVHWFFNSSGQAVFLSSNDLKVLHSCFMGTATLMYEYWGWGLQMFFKSFFLTLLYTLCHSQSYHNCRCKLHYFCWQLCPLSFVDTRMFFSVWPPLKCTAIPCFPQMFLILSHIPFVYGITIWHFWQDVLVWGSVSSPCFVVSWISS